MGCKPLKILTFLSTLISLVACGEQTRKSIDDGPSIVSGGSGSYTSGPIHSASGWKDTIYFFVEDIAPEITIEASMAAAASWNEAIGRDLLIYQGRIKPAPQKDLYASLNDTDTIIYYDTDWFKHTGKSKGVLATTVWENDPSNPTVINRGDIIMNGQDFVFQDSTEDPTDIDRIYDIADCESVIVHEMGHLIGLDHVDENDDQDSVMHAKTFVGLDVYHRNLSSDDGQRIRQIYGK